MNVELPVVVDGRPLSNPRNGIGRYTTSMLRRMCPDQRFRWHVYIDEPVACDFLALPNVRVRTLGAGVSGARRLWLSQTLFSKWAAQDRAKVFWSPRHHLPLNLPRQTSKVVTIHDLVWKKHPRSMPKLNYLSEALLMPQAIRRADHIVAVSNATLADLVSYWPVGNKTTVITEASELSPERAGTSPGVRERYFLFVGTLEPRKNLATLLGAHRLLNRKYPDVGLRIVGSRGWIQQRELDAAGPNVSFLGSVDDDALLQLYQGALATVVPSWYEGCALPVVESIALGTPVIGSTDPAIVEAMGTAGLSFPPSSMPALANRMEELLLSPDLHHQLALNAALEHDRYCWDRSASRMLDLFQSFP